MLCHIAIDLTHIEKHENQNVLMSQFVSSLANKEVSTVILNHMKPEK
jgi:hypothetical protein